MKKINNYTEAYETLNVLKRRFDSITVIRIILIKLEKNLEKDKFNKEVFKAIENADKILNNQLIYNKRNIIDKDIIRNEFEKIIYGENQNEKIYEFIGEICSERAEKIARESNINLDELSSFSCFDESILDLLEETETKFKDICNLEITDPRVLYNLIILNKLKEIHKNNPEISRVLEDINPNQGNKIVKAKKILLNTRLSKNVNQQNLSSILEDSETSYESICELVGKTYGKDAENILRERPQIKMRDIPNFDIFDEKIREMIGYGGVHTFLTYYMDSEKIITQIANNPELTRYYKEFEKITENYFPHSAIGLEEKLISFNEEKDLIKQIVDSGHQEDYAENLLLYLTDKKNYGILERAQERHQTLRLGENSKSIPKIFPEEDFKTESLEELKNYKERREKILKTYLDNNQCDKADMMSFKYFGGKLVSLFDSTDRENFLKDYLKFNKTNMTEQEVDLIELCSIFANIKNEKVLDILDEQLSKRQDVITPVYISTIKSKIAENYKQEYLDSLMTEEKAIELAEQSEKMLDKCTNSIELNEKLSEVPAEKFILKDDGNIYFSNYMETPEGVKKFRDCTVTKKKDRDTILYKYQYKTKNGEEISKTIMKARKPNGDINEFILYEMGDVGFRTLNGEIDYSIRKCPEGAEERFDDFFKTYEKKLKEAELVPQYNPEEKFKLEAGDCEGFRLRGINSNELCVSLIRVDSGRPTSQYFNYGDLDGNSSLDRLEIEKYLEGGVSTRSFYYHYYGGSPAANVGLAYTGINPNAIIGFNTVDAGTSHKIKQLRPKMRKKEISEIMEHENEKNGEVAMLRYQYDIREIRERDCWRKSKSRLYSK